MVHKEGKMRRAGLKPQSEKGRGLGQPQGERVNVDQKLRWCSAGGGRWYLGHVKDAGGNQLSGEPIQPLVEAHAAASVTALNVPAPPAAQLV